LIPRRIVKKLTEIFYPSFTETHIPESFWSSISSSWSSLIPLASLQLNRGTASYQKNFQLKSSKRAIYLFSLFNFYVDCLFFHKISTQNLLSLILIWLLWYLLLFICSTQFLKILSNSINHEEFFWVVNFYLSVFSNRIITIYIHRLPKP